MKVIFVGVLGALSFHPWSVVAEKGSQTQRAAFRRSPWGRPCPNDSSLSPSMDNRRIFSKSHHVLQRVPRGGSTTRDNLMATYLLCHGVIAMVGVPAPEVASHYAGDVVLPEGSLVHLCAEVMYTTMASLVVLLATLKYTDVSLTRAFAAPMALYTYVVYKHLVKDSYDEFGFRTGGGMAQTIFLSSMLVNMVMTSPLQDPEITAKAFCGFFLLQSSLALVSPTVGAMWYGLAKTPKGIFGSVFRWAHVMQFIFGAAGIALLCGKSVDTATAIASTLGAMAMAEQIFGGNLGIAKTRELAMVAFAILVLVAVGLFLA